LEVVRSAGVSRIKALRVVRKDYQDKKENSK
jgi:hypothetical protein